MTRFSAVNFTFRTILLIILIFVQETISTNLYNGEGGTAAWGLTYKACNGKRQSPVALPSAAQAEVKDKFPKFIRNEFFYQPPDFFKLSKNAHTIQLEPRFAKGRLNFTGGPIFDDVYAFEQLHYHWAADDQEGCEHSIDGRRYAMECHAVFSNSKYKDLGEALSKPDGLAVLGYLFQASDNANNIAMDALTSSFKFIEGGEMNVTKKTKRFPVVKLIPDFQQSYVTYPGSLTTPPCSEAVTWIVYDTPIDISHANLQKFRDLYKVNPNLINNFRPLQELNGRVVIGKP